MHRTCAGELLDPRQSTNLKQEENGEVKWQQHLPDEILSGRIHCLLKLIQPRSHGFNNVANTLSKHYGFSDHAILARGEGLLSPNKINRILPMVEIGKESTLDILAWRDKCYEAMDDDFNTPILISHLFEGLILSIS